MYSYEDRLFLNRTNLPRQSSLPPSSWSLDVEVDTHALTEMINNMNEDELGRGEANMSIYLRNAMGRICEPSLLREEGYISTIPTMSRDPKDDNRKVVWNKLLFLMRVDMDNDNQV